MNNVYRANSLHIQYQPQRQQKHCIFLHGWDMQQNIPFMKSNVPPIQQLKPFEDYLKSTIKRYGWISHRILYPSMLPFPDAAKIVCDYFIQLRKTHHLDFSNSVLIGYSTGGLVARAMTAYYNFPCTSLLTLATPHHGIRFHEDFLKGFPSVAAMLSNSDELKRINNDYLDEKMRARHHYYGLTFKGHGGLNHSNDGLVDLYSAMGGNLLGIRNQLQIHLPKREGKFTDLVHNTEALRPKYVSPFLNKCAGILKYY